MALPTMPNHWQDKFQHLEAQRYRMRHQQQRMKENWNTNAKFFQQNNVRTRVQSNFISNRSYDRSMEAYTSRDEKDKKIRKLHERRQKLGKLLERERCEFAVELRNLRSGRSSRVDIEEMKDRTEAIKSAREEKRKKVAEELLYQHWKENNRDLREFARDLHRENVAEAWVEQSERKKEEEANKDMEEQQFANEYERERMAAVERLKKKADERSMKEKERVEILKQQINEIKEREEKAAILRKEDEAIQRERMEIQQMQDERDAMETKRKNAQLQRFLYHQYKAQMRRRAQQVQEELQLDREILERLQDEENRRQDIESARQERVKQDVKWMKEAVDEQLKLEAKREAELDHIYREEARRMWEKREDEWKRERDARKKLMTEVLNERSHQMELRAMEIREEQQRLLQEREDLLEDINEVQQSSRLNKEEEEKKKQQRREELEAMMTEREERVKTARGEANNEEKRKIIEERKMQQMYHKERARMQNEGHIDRIFPRTRRAWE